jgi:hypothetical protein
MARKAQYTWGGVMMGSGISVTTLGARFLLEWSPEETAWEAASNDEVQRSILKSRLGSPPSLSCPRTAASAFATLAF